MFLITLEGRVEGGGWRVEVGGSRVEGRGKDDKRIYSVVSF